MGSWQIDTPAKDRKKGTERMRKQLQDGWMVAEMLGSVESQWRFGQECVKNELIGRIRRDMMTDKGEFTHITLTCTSRNNLTAA